MRCSAEVCTISGGSAGCFFQLRKEIQPFILFDGHFLLHVCCSHSISWRGRIFKSIDKHSEWFSMRKIGFKRVQRVWWRLTPQIKKKERGLRVYYCPTACGREGGAAGTKGGRALWAREQRWRLRRSFWPPFGDQFCIVSFRLAASYTPSPLRGPLSTGKRLTKFSVAYGSLQIPFACHP
jgi:hypothetical protein